MEITDRNQYGDNVSGSIRNVCLFDLLVAWCGGVDSQGHGQDKWSRLECGELDVFSFSLNVDSD